MNCDVDRRCISSQVLHCVSEWSPSQTQNFPTFTDLDRQNCTKTNNQCYILSKRIHNATLFFVFVFRFVLFFLLFCCCCYYYLLFELASANTWYKKNSRGRCHSKRCFDLSKSSCMFHTCVCWHRTILHVIIVLEQNWCQLNSCFVSKSILFPYEFF